jgi:hypothetical protein
MPKVLPSNTTASGYSRQAKGNNWAKARIKWNFPIRHIYVTDWIMLGSAKLLNRSSILCRWLQPTDMCTHKELGFSPKEVLA